MIVLDIVAPICLMLGLRITAAANAALLNNFEIVATALLALILFKEHVSGRLWGGILMITLACIVLSLEDIQTSYLFFHGSALILISSVCWGLENNCTRKLSSKDPLEIVLLKGIFSGSGSLIIGLCLGERITSWWCVAAVLAVGFVAYGMSVFFYVYAQRLLGGGQNQRLLCGGAVYRNGLVAADSRRSTVGELLDWPCDYGAGCVACRPG